MIHGNRRFRTWHLVPTALATGLTALVTAGAVGVGLIASPTDVEPSAPPTQTATASPTSSPSPKATRKPRHKAKAKATHRPKVKLTRKPRVVVSRPTPRATRTTTRAPVVTSGSAQAVAKSLLAARGWADQWSAFNALEMGEAGWNPRAVNPSSGACGLPQALPCSKLPNGVNSTVTQQVTWMLDYIARNYGSPAKAYAAWLSRSPHWY